MNSKTENERRIGLLGATGIGVGAIVGGGILALAGVAFSTTGPSAMLAFGLNGVIALLTALSFAEMASKFPVSGGTYAYSRKVLSVEAAFMVGWVVWFASIVAAVLYAVGFAHFAIAIVADLWNVLAEGGAPAWLTSPPMISGTAVAITVVLSIGLMLTAAGGGQWVNIAKVLVFGVLIMGGLYAVLRQPSSETGAALTPFLTAGFGGLIQAMGFTFIALQGFDLIAAVGGEVREPEKTLPRAMMFSLIIALVIYIPFLFVITTVGTPAGQAINEVAAESPEGIVAIAAQQFLGPFGYWLVMVVAVLSMYSALQANLFAASRIALAMARDRNLPSRLSAIHSKRKTPFVAVVVVGALVSAIILLVPDVGAAGAASSLIFLISFAVAHWVSILVRQRSALRPPFRVPLFPAVPVVGGLACVGLAVFQGIAVPSAGLITIIWLAIGGILFLSIFARRARVMDASSTAFNPELVTLRGRTRLVLVPIANPQNAEAMITLADALVPARTGRVLMQNVVVAPGTWEPADDPAPIEKSQVVLRELIKVSAKAGIRVEMLTTVAPQPMEEIARVARLHRCESVLMGLSVLSNDNRGVHLEKLLGKLDANVVVLRSRPDWRLPDVRQILVPIAGRGGHEHLRALLLGSLLRNKECEVTFLRVIPSDSKPDDERRAKRELARVAADEVRRGFKIKVVQNDDALGAVAELADEFDLLILGVQRLGRRKKLFGEFTRQLAQRTSCPMIVISRRG